MDKIKINMEFVPNLIHQDPRRTFIVQCCTSEYRFEYSTIRAVPVIVLKWSEITGWGGSCYALMTI